MAFCIRCSPFNCDTTGLISLSINPQSSVRPLDDESCNPSSSPGGDYIPGPGSITATLTAYAFSAGGDKWLDSRCKGQASASQQNILKYDSTTDKYWLIPSKIHRAQITGVIGKCSLGQVLFEGSIADSQLITSISITTEQSIQVGAELSYTGDPLPITIPDLNPYTLNTGNGSLSGFIQGINVAVDFPNPAVISYTFEFPLEQS